VQRRAPVVRGQLGGPYEAGERHRRVEIELGRTAFDGTGERVDADHRQRGVRHLVANGAEGLEEEERVLHQVAAGHVDEVVRSALGGRIGPQRPGVHTEGDDVVDPVTASAQLVGHPAAPDRDARRPAQAGAPDEPPSPPERPAVVDLGQGEQLPTGHADHGRDSVAGGAEHGDEPAHAGPEPVHDIWSTVRTDGAHTPRQQAGEAQRCEQACPGARRADVDHRRTEQLVAGVERFLAEGDHGDGVLAGETLDEPEQGRDDAFLPRPVDTSGDDEHDTHDRQSDRRHRAHVGLRCPRMSRDAQLGVVRWAIDSALAERAVDPPLRDLDDAAARSALFATGLTGFTAGLTARHRLRVSASLEGYLAEQANELAERHRRFEELEVRVLDVLAQATVVAIPVKGLVLAELAWPFPAERPMADIDLLVAPGQRATAEAAMRRAGFTLASRARTEDTFLGWGDGGVGRTDGESAAHNGKVELHPGWCEYLHGYTIDDRGLLLDQAVDGGFRGMPCERLPPAALVVHCLGHLSACVIRREVRGVNVLDVVLGLRALDGEGKAELAGLVDRLDPRLSAPGWWLIEQVRNGAVVHQGIDVAATIGRLTRRGREQLLALEASSVLRDVDSRSSWAWRAAWTTSYSELARMARQFALPPTGELRRADPAASPLRLHARRLRRGSRMMLRRERSVNGG
jgi:Uncharacterised nucleotidyltransferase